MKALDILNGLWAIDPTALRNIQDIFVTRMQNGHESRESIEARIGQPLGGAKRGYEIQQGVAVLPINGPIAKRATLFSDISGGASTSQVANDINAALDDPMVTSIVLDIDSPGGAVDGTQELSDLVYASRSIKPIVAVANGMMASAAMWIGASASKVFATSGTTVLGSIGVLQAHVDVSEAQKKQGVKTTEITAGKYKRIASSYQPLTDEGRATLQDQVDQVYTVMVGSIARGRGVSADTVETKMAQGRTFIGAQAVKAGLVDGIETLDSVIARAARGDFADLATPTGASATFDGMKNAMQSKAGKVNSSLAIAIAAALAQSPDATLESVLHLPTPAAAGVTETLDNKPGQTAASATTATTEAPMDIATLKAEHPGLVTALIAEGHAAGMIEGRNEGHAAGAAAERQRIQDVLGTKLKGHGALVNAMAFDGKTTGGEAAMKVLAAERERVAKGGANHEADARALDGVGSGGAPNPENDRRQANNNNGGGAAPNPHSLAASHASAETRDLSRRAVAYQDAQAKLGVNVTIAEAIAFVEKQQA